MAWYHRLRNTMRPEGISSELDRELEFHLAERIDELVAGGMTEEAARREARLRFGNPVVQKERARDHDILPWLESLVADVRYALRSLRRAPASRRWRSSPWGSPSGRTRPSSRSWTR